MASTKLTCAGSEVFAMEDLLGEIYLLLGSSKDMILAAGVSPQWRSVARSDAFRRAWAGRHGPAHVGFLVEMAEGDARIEKLLYGPHAGDVTAVAIRARIISAVLAADNVLASSNGVVLTHREGEGYCTSFPTDIPRLYKAMAPILPPIPRDTAQYTVNTFGQFGVVPKAGKSGMALFVKDAARQFITCYDGVSFCSSANIYVHVCVYDDALGWERFISQPFPSPEAALFHRNPYSVLVGKKLYMMYVVGYILCFDTVSKEFTQIALPSEVKERVKSWYEYTVASHRGGAIVLVHYHKAVVFKWVLSFLEEVPSWTLETIVDLIHSFGNRISNVAWKRVIGREDFPIGSDNFFSVQVRSASTDARFVMLTLGFDLGMFELDMIGTTVREMTNEHRTGLLGRIYSLSEPWPVDP